MLDFEKSLLQITGKGHEGLLSSQKNEKWTNTWIQKKKQNSRCL